jgi:hypothetical protein
MADIPESEEGGFRFLPEYAELIAEGTNRWAYLEYYIGKSIWSIAGLEPAIRACLTTQLFTLNAKNNALLSLLKLRKAPQPIIDLVNKFASSSRDALDARNRIAHDMWLNNKAETDRMGKIRMTGDKVLKFTIEDISINDLKKDINIINVRRLQAGEICASIEACVPSLPEIHQKELRPIIENPVPR